MGVAFWQLPAIFNWGVSQQLQKYGFSNIKLVTRDLTWSGVNITEFTATYQDSRATIDIEIANLQATYTIRQLIAGSIESLNADSASLSIFNQSNAEPKVTLPSVAPILRLLQRDVVEIFPVNTLTLPRLAVTYYANNQRWFEAETVILHIGLEKAVQPLMPASSKGDKLLNGVVRSSSGKVISWSMGANKRFLLYGSDSTVQQQVFHMLMTEVDGALTIKLGVMPNALKAWLPEKTAQMAMLDLPYLYVDGQVRDAKGGGLLVESAVSVPEIKHQTLAMQDVVVEFSAVIMANRALQQTALAIKGMSSMIEHQPVDLLVVMQAGSQVTVGGVENDNWQIQQVQLYLPQGHIVRQADNWFIQFAEQGRLSSTKAYIHDTVFEQGIRVLVEQPLALIATPHTVQLRPLNLQVALPTLQINQSHQPLTLCPDTMSLNMADTTLKPQLSTKAVFTLPQLSISNNKDVAVGEWQLNNIRQTIDVTNGVVNSHGRIENTQRAVSVSTRLQHDMTQQRGNAELVFNTLTMSTAERFQQLIKPLALPLDIVVGELRLSANAQWRLDKQTWLVTAHNNIRLDNIGGAYKELYFSGLTSQISTQVYPEIKSNKLHSLTIENLDAGVGNAGLTADFKLQASPHGALPIIDIRQAKTQWLKGSLQLKPVVYDLNRDTNQLKLVLRDIDLAELVALQQLDNIKASGLLGGVLPITINKQAMTIDDGQVWSLKPGGVINYQADNSALESNQYSNQVLRVLEDFHYDLLTATTQYQSDGSVFAKLQLKGNNPEFEQGRAINLNVNLQQNVLKLLQSLRLVEGINAKLDQRVQNLYKKQASQ